MPKLTKAEVLHKAATAWLRWFRARPEYPDQDGCLMPTEIWECGYLRGYEATLRDQKSRPEGPAYRRREVAPSPRPSFLSPDMG